MARIKLQVRDFITPGQRVHLAGIGGVSMSSLAAVLHSMGVVVQGSDISDGPSVEHLRSLGISVYIGHATTNIAGAKCLIRSGAIHDDNPEVAAAREQGIPVFERAEAWGAFMLQYKNAICIAGTNGKTTTAAMTTHIFMEAQADPTVMIGGILPMLNSGYRVGHGDTIILESCEYQNSFLYFSPTLAVILNIDADHLDFFKDLDDIKASFRRFARSVPLDGHIITNSDDFRAMDALAGLPLFTFGFAEKADCQAANISFKNGRPNFDVMIGGELYTHLSLQVTGQYNVYNALAAVSAAYISGIPGHVVKEGLERFHGVNRRFEYKGEFNGAKIYDDYAHSPGELHALLEMAETLGYRRTICAFQPHTYSRTQTFFHDFVRELCKADQVVLTEIYAAREQNHIGISSADMAKKIPGAIYCPTLTDAAAVLRELARPGDLILTVGAGDICTLGNLLINV